MKNKGLLIILSAPSGAGKSTVVQDLMKKRENFRFSVSATTRKPRIGEIDGKDYYFVTREKFEEMIAAGEFLEYAQYVDNFYGTPRKALEQQLEEGYDVILDTETQGAFQVKEKCPDALMFFLMPPSFEELESRLVSRGKDAPEVIRHRLEVAKHECSLAERYDYIIVNDNVERAANEFIAAVDKEKNKNI